MAEPDWLERLVGPYGDPRIMGVGGVIAPLWLTRRPPWFPEEFNWVIGCSYRGLPQTTAPVRNLIGTNMSFRKEILDTIGGFRSGMGRVGTRPLGCEETEFCIRASEHWPEKRWLYEPLAAVRHRVPSSRASWDYFRARCFAEGISKASVSGYVGQREGLATERDYAVRALPLGVLHGVLDALVRRDRAGLAKAGAIVVGFALATAGYLAGITFGVALPFRRKPAL